MPYGWTCIHLVALLHMQSNEPHQELAILVMHMCITRLTQHGTIIHTHTHVVLSARKAHHFSPCKARHNQIQTYSRLSSGRTTSWFARIRQGFRWKYLQRGAAAMEAGAVLAPIWLQCPEEYGIPPGCLDGMPPAIYTVPSALK